MSRYQRVSDSDVNASIDPTELAPPYDPSSAPSIPQPLSPHLHAQTENSTTFEEITEEEMESESRRLLTSEEQNQAATSTISLPPPNPSFISTPQRNSRSGRTPTLPASTDGVFANLSAKPGAADELKDDEAPPTYETAAQDSAPPYWQTTVIAPSVGGEDQVLVEGLPVGNVFNFVWNTLISASFQFIGFMLTYMLHTSHAAKNGSRAGLGITFIQYGFYLRNNPSDDSSYLYYEEGDQVTNSEDIPSDPDRMQRNELIAYMLMVVGWFIVIRSVSDYVRARRMEQLIQTSPADAAV